MFTYYKTYKELSKKINNNGFEYVDLGLPSGTLWAAMNIGASKPSDYGLYFQWGDSRGYTAEQVGTGAGKKKFADDWSDYKWGVSPNFTKYTSKTSLDLEDDAAHVNMGGDWHMPSPDQIEELIDNTTSVWTTQDGVNGRLFTSKTDNSKSIFIPAAGFASGGSLDNGGREAEVWSNTLYMENVEVKNSRGYSLFLISDHFSMSTAWRYFGLSVRGVIETSGDVNGHSYVDLGLPSGILWATMNVGASKPSDAGLYFQWGDTIGYAANQVGTGDGQKKFSWSDYKWSVNGSSSKFSKYGLESLQLEDDAAHVNMGDGWHIPTYDQVNELLSSTDYKFTTLDGVSGIAFTSKNDSSKSIFFPTAGGALNGSVIKSGEGVAIWLDMLDSNDSGSCIAVTSSRDIRYSLKCYTGLPIRGVMNG